MSKEKAVSTPEKRHYSFRVGYFEAKRILRRISQFKLLVAYYFNIDCAGYSEKKLNKILNNKLAPWAKAEPKKTTETERRKDVKSQINKRLWSVYSGFRRLDLRPKYTWTKDQKQTTVDVLKDIFNLPADKEVAGPHLLIQDLERAEGLAEFIIRLRIKGSWKPTTWLAWLANMPARILRDSGVNMEDEKTSKYYYFLLQALTGLVLTLAIIKLGISIDILKLFRLS